MTAKNISLNKFNPFFGVKTWFLAEKSGYIAEFIPNLNYKVAHLQKIFRFFFSLYGFFLFLLLMILLFPLFIYCFLKDDVKGGNMIYKVCRFWADVFFLLTGIKHTNIYEEEHDSSRQYIFVSNHISYLDIPMMMKAIRKQHIRILGKIEMSTIPLFGLIYKKAVIVVDRENVMQRRNSMKHLIAFVKLHISVFICPEGTFNMTDCPLKSFYNGAFRIAIETQKPIRPILFLDTYDRLNYRSIFSLNPGKCRAVFLPETTTEGLSIEDVPMLKEKIYKQMEDGLIRYNVNWVKEK